MKFPAHNPQQERILALKISWAIISIVILIILLLPFLMPEQQVYKLAPVCISKARYGLDCPACGMTRAFVAISAGDLSAAWQFNRGSPFLYAFFGLNSLLFVALSLGKRRFFSPFPASNHPEPHQPG